VIVSICATWIVMLVSGVVVHSTLHRTHPIRIVASCIPRTNLCHKHFLQAYRCAASAAENRYASLESFLPGICTHGSAEVIKSTSSAGSTCRCRDSQGRKDSVSRTNQKTVKSPDGLTCEVVVTETGVFTSDPELKWHWCRYQGTGGKLQARKYCSDVL